MTAPSFTVADHAARISRTLAAAGAAGLDGVLVAPGPDLLWLTGFRPSETIKQPVLLILRHGWEPVLVLPAVERRRAEAAAGVAVAAILDWSNGTDPYKLAAGLLPLTGRFAASDSIAPEHLVRLHQLRPDTRYLPMSRCLPMLRAVKDTAEIARVRATAAAADDVYRQAIAGRFAFRRESEVAMDLGRLLRGRGHEQVDVVVGGGPNGAVARHRAGRRMILPGDVLVLRVGGLLDGYGCAITRTLLVGSTTEPVRLVHDVVERAGRAAFAAIRPGVPVEEIDQAARRVIRRAGYEDQLAGHTGHGVGVRVEEPPYLAAGERHRLEPGMCLTIGAAVHLRRRFGVRLTDTVAVTDLGAARLHRTAHDLRIVS